MVLSSPFFLGQCQYLIFNLIWMPAGEFQLMPIYRNDWKVRQEELRHNLTHDRVACHVPIVTFYGAPVWWRDHFGSHGQFLLPRWCAASRGLHGWRLPWSASSSLNVETSGQQFVWTLENDFNVPAARQAETMVQDSQRVVHVQAQGQSLREIRWGRYQLCSRRMILWCFRVDAKRAVLL